MIWNLWSVYWLAWFGVGFLGPEIWALVTNPANTLSYQVWHVEGINLAHPYDLSQWTFAHYLVFALMIWLCFHFVDGMFR